MIIFFYGPDTFRSRQKVSALRERFLGTPGAESNLSELDGTQVKMAELNDAVLAAPFLAKNRLVIVRGLLSVKGKLADNISELLERVPHETVLVIVEAEVDKRGKLFKELKKIAKSEEFPALEGAALNKWIAARVQLRGGTIGQAEIRALVDACGADLWRLSNEIDKLVAYRPNVTKESIELLVSKAEEPVIFDLTDAIGTRDRQKALRQLESFLRTGESELYLVTMIGRHLRQLAVVKDLSDRKLGNPSEFGKHKIHPYSAQKMTAQARNFSYAEIAEMTSRLAELERQLKSSGGDPRLLLEQYVLGLTAQVKS